VDGDMWFDITNDKWKRFNSTIYVDSNALPIGVCIQDESGNTVGARSEDSYIQVSSVNTFQTKRVSNSVASSVLESNQISVFGTLLNYRNNLLSWSMASHLESGQTEAASTTYYLYIKENGNPIISETAPYNREYDLLGFYHPYEMWRNVGIIENDGSSNFKSLTPAKWGPIAQINNVRTVTANSVVDAADDYVLGDTTSASMTTVLPPAAGLCGKVIRLKKTSADFNVWTIDGFASETIDADATQKLINQNESMTLVCDGSNWFIIDQINNGLWERKELSGDFTTTGAEITDLTFSNLIISRNYRITSHFWVTKDSVDTIFSITVYNSTDAAIPIGYAYYGNSNTSTNDAVEARSFTTVFQASTTTCRFVTSSLGAGTIVHGDGSLLESYAVLEELPFIEETTRF
jgi:hypothetical protein